MSTHNLYFRPKIRKKMVTPVHPSFTIQKWGVRGYSLHRLVFVMDIILTKMDALKGKISP